VRDVPSGHDAIGGDQSPPLTHTYTSQGIYTASAHLVDSKGLTASASLAITVYADNTNGTGTGSGTGPGHASSLTPVDDVAIVGAVGAGAASVWGGIGLLRWHHVRKARRALAEDTLDRAARP
ncbi:MAG: hypothetical protein JRN35_07280, partial [Nitrososphaerota archaeon]|nr:hypothetical protein [Nitrososphaerota archaeon]